MLSYYADCLSKLRRNCLPLLMAFFLVLLCMPVDTAHGFQVKHTPTIVKESSTPTKQTAQLGTTYKDKFNATFYEKVYILKVTDPGIYLINVSATIYSPHGYGWDGELLLETWGEVYYPWLDKYITEKEKLDSISYNYNGTWIARKYVFVSPGELILHWNWSFSWPDIEVEAELIVIKQASLSNAIPIVEEINITEGSTSKLLKIDVAKEAIYNITLSSVVSYNADAYLRSAYLEISTDWIEDYENLTVYLNNYKVGVISGNNWFYLPVPLEYVNLTGENNLTLVYKGPDNVTVYYAELDVCYWDWNPYDGWYLDQDWVSYWWIYEDVSNVWSGKAYAWSIYTHVPLQLYLLDEIHGQEMLNTIISVSGITINTTTGIHETKLSIYPVLAHLEPNVTYYLWIDIGSFKPEDCNAVVYITLEGNMTELKAKVIDTAGSIELSFNANVRSDFVVLQLSPDKYYNLSLRITEGGNWSVQAIAVPFFPMDWWWYYYYGYPNYISHKIWGKPHQLHENRISVQNLATIRDWYLLYWYYGMYYRTLPLRNIMGSYENFLIYVDIGEVVNYTDGSFVGLLENPFMYGSTDPVMILWVMADPIYYDPETYETLTPSESVKVNISAIITGDIETISPGVTLTLKFNATTGPRFKVFKAELDNGKMYLLEASPLAYENSGYIYLTGFTTSIEDWWSYFSRNEMYIGTINSSAYLAIAPLVPNTEYYIVLSVWGGDTSEVSLKISEYSSKNYALGTKLTLNLKPVETAPETVQSRIYKFDVHENYTYVITVEKGDDFVASANILIVDMEGNTLFKYQHGTHIVIEPYDYPRESSLIFTANETTTVTMIIWGGSGSLNITITEIKSYEAGYEEGYEAGFEEGNATGFELGNETGYELGFAEGNATGFELGNETGYELGFEEGNETGYSKGFESGASTGRITGVAIGASVGAVISAAIVYVISRRMLLKGA